MDPRRGAEPDPVSPSLPTLPRLARHLSRRAFTLLEVVIALGILSIGLLVLIDAQTTAVMMTTDMERTQAATMLANEKMHEVIITLEAEGWTSQAVEEEGDFTDFGNEDFRGDSLGIDTDGEYEDFKWAYTVREIELSLPGDIMGAAGDLADNGYWGDQSGVEEQQDDSQDAMGGMDLSSFGITPEVITEYLSDYIREVRIVVWWGDNEDETDQVELTHHVINITGVISDPETDE